MEALKYPLTPCSAAYLIDRALVSGCQICGYGFCSGFGNTWSSRSVVSFDEIGMLLVAYSSSAATFSARSSRPSPWSRR